MDYRKKPVVIQAIQFDGSGASATEITKFAGGLATMKRVREEYGDGRDYDLVIPTLEGEHTASPGDFIIRGVKGEFYPCKPDIFAATYEPVGDSGDFTPAKGLGFGAALLLLKQGKKLRRPGWNGKGMYIVRQPGYPEGIGANANTARALGISEGTIVKTRPYLAMMDAQGMLVTGWLASQTDLLAEDWELAE
jgi:hypothetical protein